MANNIKRFSYCDNINLLRIFAISIPITIFLKNKGFSLPVASQPESTIDIDLHHDFATKFREICGFQNETIKISFNEENNGARRDT